MLRGQIQVKTLLRYKQRLEDQFLQDPTGNRRYLPIEVGKVNVAGIKSIHPQLWAEAAVMFTETGIQWGNAQVLAQTELGQYETVEPWESVIAEWLNNPYTPIINPSTDEILTSCLQIDVGRWTPAHKSKIKRIMKKLGYESKQCGSGANRACRWFKKQ